MKKILLYLLSAASLNAATLTVSSDVDTFMTAANYAAMRTQLALTIGTNVQAYDADLTTYAGITPAANTQSLLGAANYAAMRGLLDLEPGTDFLSVAAIAAAYQPLDIDLTSWGTVAPSANGLSLASAANYAAMRALLDLEAGTDFLSVAAIAAAYQPLDADLTSVAALTTTAAGLAVLTYADPNADRILFWDDSAGAFANLTVGSGLDLTGTTLTATGGGTGDVTAAANFGTDNRLIRSDGVTKGVQSTGITVSDADAISGVASMSVTGAVTAGSIAYNGALAADDTAGAITLTGLTAGATIAQWEAVYIGGSSTYLLADANGTLTYPARGLAVAAYVDTNAATIVTSGTVRNDAWAWTPGGTIYLSTTAGGLTQTIPATTGDKIQVIGYALTADIMMVAISPDFGTSP